MRSTAWLFALSSALLLSWVQPAVCQTEVEPASFYTVSDFDEARDPAADLKATVERAQKEGKRILLDVGGTWCSWCTLLDAYFHENAKVSERLQNGYLVMKVNYSSGNKNEAFLGEYPKIQGYPFLFVLEKDGTLLHAQNTGDLEEGRGYNEVVVLAFLDEWAPKG